MTLLFESTLPPKTVVDYLIDPEKFVRVHPIIFRMEPLAENTFKVYEKVKFGFIPYSFTYTAIMESDRSEGKVTIRATVQRMTHINMDFRVSEFASGAVVEEKIEIKSPLPIRRYMLGLLKKQHELMFANMETEVKMRVDEAN